MKRTEFIAQLREQLREVEQEEKEEALQYYEDYLEEAGILENTEVPEAFGTPWRVAQTVRNGLSGGFEEAEFTERGFREFEEQKNQVDSFGGIVKSGNQSYQDREQNDNRRREKGMGIAALLLIFVAGVIGGPVVFSILAVLASFLFCGVIVVAAGIITAAAGGAALLITGAILCGVGIVKLFAAPFAGIVLIGSGLVSMSIGLLGVMAGVLVAVKILPKVLRKTIDLCKKIFQKRSRRERSV